MAMLDRKMIEGLILNVQKPGRYLGGELNSIVKMEADIRCAVSYPDLYDVGMSNNGIRILYDAANRMEGVACERVFAVQDDFEKLLRQRDIPLFTLESLTPLKALDMLAFNLSHELLFTNVLQILDLGRIPFISGDRRDDDPVIMAGGSAASNPFPMAGFIDAFFIGDGEEGFPEILGVLKLMKKKGAARPEKLKRLSEIHGVLVPSYYHFKYDGNKIMEAEGEAVHKRIYRGASLNNPLKPIVPNIRIAQSRAVYEIARGCGNFCRFCHAGYYDLPYRENPFEKIRGDIFEIIGNTGYDELSLSALSISDYKQMTSLLNAILPGLSENGVSISLPSLRVDMATLPVIERISDLRKTSLTFAVESASEEIRGLSNKRLSNGDLYSIVDHVFKAGWKLIKLYFMIGLPGCGRHDEAESIISMLLRIKAIAGRGSEINVTLSPFVPKPHTPFQREKQFGAEYFYGVIGRIKQRVPRSIKIKSHDVESSLLEGVFSRGDGRLGGVILKSYLDGCRFDSWNEKFNFNVWRRNLDSLIPGWDFYLEKRGEAEMLPWDFIKTGFEKITLAMESKVHDAGDSSVLSKPVRVYKDDLDVESFHNAVDRFKKKYIITKTARIRVCKMESARFIPHLDYIEVIKRGCRMAGLPVSFSQGFNKRERISFGYPLPLGIESGSELFDIDLYGDIPGDIEIRLEGKFPAGIKFQSWHYPDARESLMAVTAFIEYNIITDETGFKNRIIENIQRKISFAKETKKGKREISFSAIIERFEPGGDGFKIRLFAGTPDSLRVDHVMMALAETDMAGLSEIRIVKIGQFRADGREIF